MSAQTGLGLARQSQHYDRRGVFQGPAISGTIFSGLVFGLYYNCTSQVMYTLIMSLVSEKCVLCCDVCL